MKVVTLRRRPKQALLRTGLREDSLARNTLRRTVKWIRLGRQGFVWKMLIPY